MARIFISYRREDSGGDAGRLCDDLRDRLGQDSVFRDIDGLEPGVDYLEKLREAIVACDVVLVLIGKRWLTLRDGRRGRRLDNPDDVVRLEIATALSANLLVIPVLVRGAQMPRIDRLPDVLRPLTERQAFEINDRHWRDDVDQLASQLDGGKQEQEPKAVTPLPSTPARSALARPHFVYVSIGAGAAIVVAALAANTWLSGLGMDGGAAAVGSTPSSAASPGTAVSTPPTGPSTGASDARSSPVAAAQAPSGPLASPQPSHRWIVGSPATVATIGLRLRRTPSDNGTILMELTNGSTVEIVEVPTPGSIDDGWVSVSSQSAPDGVVGWVPERFLAPVLNEPRATDSPLSSWCNGMYGSINAGRVRLYNSPSMAGSILRELQRGLVVRIGEQPVQRPNGVWWVKVSVNAADDVGWIPEQFVSVVLDQPRLWPSPPLSLVGTPASTPVPRPLPPLSRDVETTFTPQALLPYVEDASVQHGADPRLVLAILMKESSLKNWQIGPDGNGFGLIGPDTAHHRPEHERAVGVSIGTDTNPGTVSPEKQIDFLAHVLATYTTTCSGDTAAAVRVWYGGMASSGGEDASAFRGEVDHNVRTLFGP